METQTLVPNPQLKEQALGILLIQQSQPGPTKGCLNRAHRFPSNPLPSRPFAGKLAINEGPFQAAIDYFEQLLSLDPSSAETATNLALAPRPRGQLENSQCA